MHNLKADPFYICVGLPACAACACLCSINMHILYVFKFTRMHSVCMFVFNSMHILYVFVFTRMHSVYVFVFISVHILYVFVFTQMHSVYVFVFISVHMLYVFVFTSMHSLYVFVFTSLYSLYVFVFSSIRSLYEPQNTYASCLVFSTLVWLAGIFFLRTALKLLLTYKGWMFEPRGKTSLQTKIWAVSHSGHC